VVRAIVAAGIDVLVDLNGYSRPGRMALFARRPAPVQVAWFNYYATSGMDCFDAVFVDATVLPAGEERFCSEPVVRVPHCYLAFEVGYPVPDVDPAPSLSRGYVTFGCFAPHYKVTPEVVATWARILNGSPATRLVLKSTLLGTGDGRSYVRAQFERAGVPADRVELDGPAEHFDFLAKYGDVDLALDTFPYNGGTTTMEALWQGVPVLAFCGDRWASRISASLVLSAGLAEFVSPDVEAHVALAAELANAPGTPARLDALRRTMRGRLARSAACDPGRQAEFFEREYLRLYGWA
jgi:predicted O-linked N-acetylglucosamine transferase (SPINDLY family)